MLWTPPGPCFQAYVTNLTGRPTTGSGTSVTADPSNSKGGYTEIISGASVPYDIFGLSILFGESNASGDNCEILADLGVDPTDSDAYAVKIANLQAGHAANRDGGIGTAGALGGIPYYFPLFFPAGTQFGFRGQTNDNTSKPFKVTMHLYGKPKYPHLARAGSYCDTFGANTTTSQGVAVTPGTTSEGDWTDISGADTTKPYWFWEMGMSTADTTMTNAMIYGQDLGVGDGSNKHIVHEDQYWVANGQECLSKDGARIRDGYYEVGAGVRPYIRSQCSGTPDANMNCCVYAVGG